MSTTTTYLGLVIPDGADNTTISNLERIDAAFQQLTTGSDGSVYINASNKVILQPQAADSGGAGTGGEVELGSSGNTLTVCRVYGPTRGDSFVFNSSSASYQTTLNGHTAAGESITYTLPQNKATRAGQQVLVSDAGASTQTLSFASIGQLRAISVVSAATLAMTSASSRAQRFTTACTVTLPQANTVTDDEFIFIGECSIDGYGSETIDGAATLSRAAGEFCMLKSDGSNWWRIA